MYRFMRRKCQEKNDNEVEKVATISSESDGVSLGSPSQKMTRVEKRDHQSRECIVPGVRKNSCAQVSSEQREQTEKRAEHGQKKHCSRSFIPVRDTKHQRREHHASSRCAARPHSELMLQIPAKYKLFRNSYQPTKHQPTHNLFAVARR